MLDKEEVTLFEALDDYIALYKPRPLKLSEKLKIRKEYIIGAFTFICICLIIYLYK